MEAPLQILLVLGEEPERFDIIQQELNRAFGEVEIHRAEIERDYFSFLDKAPQAIVSDFQLRQFGALRALQLLREKELNIPVIVIGDDVGAEAAVECIKQGAADFLLKEHLSRLGQVVKRAVREGKVKRDREKAETELQESTGHYRHIVDSCPVGVALQKENRMVFVNRAGARLLGAASRKQLTDKSLTSFSHPDFKQTLTEALQGVESEEAGMAVLEGKFSRLDGEVFTVELEAAALTQDQEQGIIIVFRDVTEKTQQIESQFFEAGLLAHLSDAIVAVNSEDHIVYWNQSAAKLYGVPGEEAVGKKPDQIYQQTWPSTGEESAARAALLRSGSWHGQLVHTKNDGAELHVESSLSPIQDEKGSRNGAVAIIRDVTEKREVENTLKKERNFYSSVLTAASTLMVVHDKEGRIILFNQACERTSGYSTNEVRRKQPWEFLLPTEEVESAKAFFGELKTDRFPHNYEGHWIHRDGTQRLISWSDTALADEAGSVACVVSAGVDITEQKEKEAEARGGTEYLSSLMDATPDLFVVLDEEGTVRFGGGAVESALECNPPDLAGKKLADLIHPEDVQEFNRVLEEVKQKPSVCPASELRLRGKDDPWRTMESYSRNLLNDEAVSGILLVARDITWRKNDENRMRRQLQSLETMHAIDMATSTSLDLEVTLKVIVEQLTSQLQMDAACILLFNPQTQVLSYGSGRGFHSIAISQADSRLGEGPAGRAALERRTVRIADLSETADESSRLKLLRKEEFVMYCATPLVSRGELKGILEVFTRSPFTPEPEWEGFLETVASQLSHAVDNTGLIAQLRRSGSELGFTFDATLEAVAQSLDRRDQLADGHSRRVAEMTVRMGRVLGMSEEELVHTRRGALLHDIGKLIVPEAILFKPDRLSDEETNIVRQHPAYARELLTGIPGLRNAVSIPYCHNEKWDGSGYPGALKGKDIPLSARIFSVVDAWDVLQSVRPFREAWPRAKVESHLRSQSGKDFDPEVVDTFLQLEKEGQLSIDL